MLSDEIVSLGSEADLLMQRDTEAESQEDLDPMEVARRQNLALLEEEEAARAAWEREMEAENIRKAQQNSVQPQLQPPSQPQPPAPGRSSNGVRDTDSLGVLPGGCHRRCNGPPGQDSASSKPSSSGQLQ